MIAAAAERESDHRARIIPLYARPVHLELAERASKFHVPQRSSKSVPGSRGYLRVTLDDITAGQVLLTLSTAENDTLIASTSVEEAQVLSFAFGGRDYMLRVKRLVNLLMGDDFARLEGVDANADVDAQISALLAIVAAADITFIRNGEAHPAAEAAEHLRKKYNGSAGRIDSLDMFIEQLASRSTETGQPYQVKVSEHEVIDAREWLMARKPESVAATSP